MSFGIFTDQAVGLEVRQDRVGIAWVRRGLKQWVVVETSSVPCPDPEDLPEVISGIMVRIPRHIPIIPIAPDLFLEVVDVPPGSIAGPAGSDLLLDQMAPFSPDTLQWTVAGPAPGTDRPMWIITSRFDSEKILDLLNREVLRSPGVMDAGTALTGVFHVFPESPDGHGMMIDVNANNIRILCLYNRHVVFMRSILREGLDILPDVAVTIRAVQNHHPEWMPTAIYLLNRSIQLTGPEELIRNLPPIVPFAWNEGDKPGTFKHGNEHETLLPIGAAVIYLMHGRQRVLKPWNDTRTVIPIVHSRTVFSLVLFLLLLLMASWDVWIQTNRYNIRFQSEPSIAQEDIESVLGFLEPSSGEFEPGASLGEILITLADASDDSISFNDIRGDTRQLTFSGRMSELADVSEFTHTLSTAFPQADVSIVSMDRSEEGSMDVTIQVSEKTYGDER